jgi:hypothetical protein
VWRDFQLGRYGGGLVVRPGDRSEYVAQHSVNRLGLKGSRCSATSKGACAEDKRRGAVMKLLEDAEWQTWSSYEIAERCNVSHTFVDKMKSEILTCNVASEAAPAERTYTTKHGTKAR